MSEPMSSGEIEDVLSSIRRLVSEDLRPSVAAGSGSASGATAVTAEAGGKLLLTPALRVVAKQDSVPKAVQKAPFIAVDEDDEDGSDKDGDDAFAVLSPTKPDNADAEDDEMNAKAAFDAAEQDEDWLPESSDEADTYPGWAKPETEPSDSDMSRVVHEIAAGVSDGEDDWEPEAGDAPVATMSWQAPEWVEEAELAEDGAAADDRVSAKAAADLAEEAAVAEIKARAAQAKSDADAKTAPPAPEDDIFADDDGVYDETVLRDLVRDLIREELSGTLGERITRNVRKLVRAEINRALTARDFD